jgi:hypothetical protein
MKINASLVNHDSNIQIVDDTVENLTLLQGC